MVGFGFVTCLWFWWLRFEVVGSCGCGSGQWQWVLILQCWVSVLQWLGFSNGGWWLNFSDNGGGWRWP